MTLKCLTQATQLGIDGQGRKGSKKYIVDLYVTLEVPLPHSNRFLKHQEVKKMSEQLRAKPHTAQLFKRGSENQDPNEAAKSSKGGNKLKTVSRLPVLAKSMQPVLTDISQSPGHKRWEERPLLGKAQKRKTCTKPVPFSLSQPRTRGQPAEAVSEKERSGMPLTRPSRQTPSKTLATSQHGTKTRTPAQRSAVAFSPDPSALRSILLNEGVKGNGPVGATSQASGRGTSIYSLIVSERLSVYLLGSPKLKLLQHRPDLQVWSAIPFSPDPSALRSILLNEGIKAAGPVGATPRMSTCPTARGTSIYSAQRVPVKKPQTEAATAVPGCTGGTVPFSPDPSALRSILLNEGIKAAGPVGATPRMSTCPTARGTSIYSAQRVPVKKPPTEAATAVPGCTGSTVPFSPDLSALRSILLNEGIKAAGPVGATPRSTCPTGRGTSIYSVSLIEDLAQRVPLKKVRAEGAVTEAARADFFSICVTYSCQPDSQHEVDTTTSSLQPVTISAPAGFVVRVEMECYKRKLICAPKTPLFNASPGICKSPAHSTASSTQQEEDVVQRLFQEEPEQEENEQMEEGGDEATGPSLEHHQTVEAHLKHEESTITKHCHSEKENDIPAAQPFIQAPHRQSVIVLSSGQRLFSLGSTQVDAQAPVPQIPEQLKSCTTSTEVQSTVPAPSAQCSGSRSALNPDSKHITPSALCKTKASGLSSAVCALRRRLPPLEELFLDEECATYTSCQQSWPAQPRCINPVASTLLFQDSTCFVPIGSGTSNLSPVPHLPSPIRA
ncbi:hypothetical protein NFI96_017575 [Prochilodus magdalenae]|nr:hypothetical protein NFI96_017575 [Prochilodus magdalenae]